MKKIKWTEGNIGDLTGKTIIITGANSGIGFEATKLFSKNGAKVIMGCRNLEKAEIKSNVLANEPHLALFVEDNDALIFYRKIAELATKNLSVEGKLFFEINQYLGKETVELLEKMHFKNIELRKDIYGNDRMISCNI